MSGILTLGGYLLFFDGDDIVIQESSEIPAYTPVSMNTLPENSDFTEAANRSVNAVVHVKNQAITRSFMGSSTGLALQGTGSGVIVSPDGYIVTNYHVIKNASRLQVTLNNNQNYMAEVIGTDPETDIALLKIEAEDLNYLPFGDSDNVRIGEWVLAVGNPFNLTSTVTAGIISAKSRDLEMGAKVSYFLQTDAAVNPGNSGGALVNTRGELIGINTAITSQTGTYVGYSFAVPSNNARKIVEDILEYGDVQQGILGVRGLQAAELPKDFDLGVSEGVYVGEVEPGSGAEKAGIRSGDIISQIDEVKIRRMSDLTGYIGSKRPNDIVEVKVLREGEIQQFDVRLTKKQVFQIREIGLEVANATPDELRQRNISNGVKITRGLTPQMQNEELYGTIITAIDNISVKNIDDVEKVLNRRNSDDPISVTFVTRDGEFQKYVWR